MIYVLAGEDDYSIREALRRIKTKAAEQSFSAAADTEVDARDLTLEKLRVACETVPFMGEQRLVVVHGLFSRFQAKARGGAKKSASPREDWKPFLACLEKLPASTILVLVDGPVNATNPLFKGLGPRAEVKIFSPLAGYKLKEWIQARVAAGGGRISPPAADLLIRHIGSELGVMGGEIDKLLLYAQGREIREEDVRSLVGFMREASIFTLVDAVLDGRAAVAESLLQQLLNGGAAPPYILTMLSRQVRLIVLAKELKEMGKSSAELQAALRMKDFAVQKTVEQAARYSWERLKDVYRRLLEADLNIKTGRYDGELALDILVAELCRLPEGRPGRGK